MTVQALRCVFQENITKSNVMELVACAIMPHSLEHKEQDVAWHPKEFTGIKPVLFSSGNLNTLASNSGGRMEVQNQSHCQSLFKVVLSPGSWYIHLKTMAGDVGLSNCDSWWLSI